MTLAGDRTSRLLSVVALLGSLSLDVHADVIQLTSPPPLLNSARVTTVTYTSTQDLLPSPLVLTVPDNTLTLTLAIGDWRRAAQGQNIFGNFAFGTQLLYTNNNNFLAFDGVTTVGGGGSGPVEIEFASPVDLFWLRAQNGVIGPEMFTFSVFDGETLLGTFSVGGVSGQESNEALTAPIGARATQGACVTRVVISSQSFGSGQVLENDFYFGPISFRTIRGQRCEARPGPSAVRSIAQLTPTSPAHRPATR